MASRTTTQQSEGKEQAAPGRRLGRTQGQQEKIYEDMSETEQQILEDFDTQKLRKQYENQRIEKPGNRLRKEL